MQLKERFKPHQFQSLWGFRLTLKVKFKFVREKITVLNYFNCYS